MPRALTHAQCRACPVMTTHVPCRVESEGAGSVAVPRFLFVSGVRGEPQAELSRLTGVSWRLLGGNNRELGRSAEVFSDLQDCQLAALDVRERIADAAVELRSENGSGRWTWQLRLDDQPVAIAGRSYLRLRECQYNLAQFIAFAPAAGVAHATIGRRQGNGRPEVLA
jgi:hypothetical protein